MGGMKKAITVLLGIAVLWQLAGAADVPKPGDEILGVWHTTDDKSKVEIFKKRDQYFARILSLKEPNWPLNDEQGMGGKAKTDRKNPARELRSRAIAGLEFMNDFVYAGKNKWTDGKIYDPEVGKTYSCKMTLVSANKLEVRGYVGFSMLGRTVVWTR
jgi:uncharacterized protein (DUF2147 family)